MASPTLENYTEADKVGYFVFNPEAAYPQYKHRSMKAAKDEALRLAHAHKGFEFHILKSCGFAKAHEPVYFTEIK